MRVTGGAGTVVALAESVRTGERSAVQLLDEALDRAEEVEPQLGAFTVVARDRARQEAQARAEEAAAGRLRGPLHGVPVAVKDLFDVLGEVTEAGSRIPPSASPAVADAELVRLLRAAGAVVLGRTRTHEYAWGLTTQHDVLGGTRNPYDPARVPGGSSGGSAAAVAAGVVPLALATDTAGSIRLPAAWCGLVGHKPTYGRVSLAGAVPLAPSLDHGGALVRTVADARVALSVLSGDQVVQRRDHLTDVRVGRIDDPTLPAADAAVDRVLARTAEAAAAEGAVLRHVRVPSWKQLRRVFVAVQGREAADYHRALGHWPARAELYDSGVRSRLAAADAVAEQDAREAQRQRVQLRRDAIRLFEEVDVLLQPVAGCGPSRTDEPDVVLVDGRREDLRSQVLPHTLLASVCGLPACSVPCGVDDDGLPVGVQVVGPPGSDALVLDVADVLHTLLGAEVQPPTW